MSEDLKNTGKGNLFVILVNQILMSKVLTMNQYGYGGVDVFDPRKGEVRSDNADGIACWLIDTDYSEEAFRAPSLLSRGKRPLQSFENSLKAEIDEEAGASLNSDGKTVQKPSSGCIAVKVINHLGMG